MKTIYGDYNAMTEAGHMCLTTRGSRRDMEELGLHPGDWVWLTDTELVVGALISTDSYYGVVGVPDWDTLVHLDDDGADDVAHITAELDPLLAKDPRSNDDERRLFELLTQLEFATRPQRTDRPQEFLAFQRAVALRQMGKLGLAMVEIETARAAQSDDPAIESVYHDLLRLMDLSAPALKA
jgi:hypothetical protein